LESANEGILLRLFPKKIDLKVWEILNFE